MKFPRLTVLLSLVLACVAAAPCRAEKRPPTAPERAMLNNYRDVIHRILDSFENDDWTRVTTTEYDLDDDVLVSSDPDVPLDVDELIQRTYRVRPGSDYYNRVYMPAIEKMEATDDMKEKVKIAKTLEVSEVTIMVHFNRAGVSLDGDSSTREKLNLAGPSMAFRTPNGHDQKSVAVELLYGDWASAAKSGGDLKYRFKRKGRYPAIENIWIEISGTPSRIDEMLRNLDWKQPNTGLTQEK
ncbi:MAG TPA: hypothetical protein VKB38_00700 [Terracidiphilus sp.]|nr:hypothetical protein [Terracidiphilus sp.]